MDVIKALLEGGANPNLQNGPGGFLGMSPLYLASYNGYQKVVQVLLNKKQTLI